MKRCVRVRLLKGFRRRIECLVDSRLVADGGRGVLHDLVLNFLKTNFNGNVDVGGGAGHSSNFFKDDVR